MRKPKSNSNSFKKGRQKTGGRKAGALNKITVAVKDVIAMAAQRIGGLDRLVKWILKSPKNERLFWSNMYMRLLPLQINTKVERTDTVVYKTVEEFRVALIERGMPEESIKSLLQLPGPENQTRQ
jgi:hypothetical protein